LYEPVAPETVSFEAGVGLISKYIWRGVNLNDDVVIQPDVVMHVGAFTGAVWASMDTTDDANDAGFEFTEARYIAQYGTELYDLDITFGYVYYDRSKTDLKQTSEIFAGARLADYIIEPAIAVYLDIDEAEGAWVVLSGTYINEPSEFPWRADASIGYGTEDFNRFYFSREIKSTTGGVSRKGADDSGITDITLGASTDLELGNGLMLTPFINLTVLVDGAIRSFSEDDVNIYGGAMLSGSF